MKTIVKGEEFIDFFKLGLQYNIPALTNKCKSIINQKNSKKIEQLIDETKILKEDYNNANTRKEEKIKKYKKNLTPQKK